MLTSGINCYNFLMFCSHWVCITELPSDTGIIAWYVSIPDSLRCLINLLWNPKLASSLESWSFFWKRLCTTRCSEIRGNTSAWQCTRKFFILWCYGAVQTREANSKFQAEAPACAWKKTALHKSCLRTLLSVTHSTSAVQCWKWLFPLEQKTKLMESSDQVKKWTGIQFCFSVSAC